VAGVLYDSQFDETHRVLRNRLNITDAEILEEHIARLSFFRVAELEASPLPFHFDIRHLRLIHRHIFQDVFPWAGDFREVTTSRTNSFGFPPPQFLIPSLETLFAALKAEKHLGGLGPDAFADRAGHYLGELNAIHPFREGNGRAQREFIRSLAIHAGHKLSWRNLTPAENNEASRISYATGIMPGSPRSSGNGLGREAQA
jgi:cell filamentation protein